MNFDEAVALVRSRKSFMVTPHRRPDGDALGAALGLAEVLRSLGKHVIAYSPDEIPENLKFMTGVDQVHRQLPDHAVDATFVTDTADPKLLPQPFPEPDMSGTVVVLDHHAVHVPFGDVVLRDIGACATGEIVVRFARALGLEKLPPGAATPLYASIVADTGGFRYPGTTPSTLRLGAELLEQGVDPWNVAFNLFEAWPKARLDLLREVIGEMRLELDGRLAVMRVDREMMERTSADSEMADGLVNYGRRVIGVEVAVLLLEDDGKSSGDGPQLATRVSLRSRGTVDVAAIAAALGGGGHRAAAGATLPGSIEEVGPRVVAEVDQALDAP